MLGNDPLTSLNARELLTQEREIAVIQNIAEYDNGNVDYPAIWDGRLKNVPISMGYIFARKIFAR